MHTRPALPPMLYRIFLPHVGVYANAVDWAARRIRYSPDAAGARVLPEREARSLAQSLIRASALVVELRPLSNDGRSQ